MFLRRLGLPIILVVYGAVIACGYWFTSNSTDRQTWAVVVTGAVVIWYSWETMRLRATGIRPYVTAIPSDSYITVANVSSAPAVNVRIRDIVDKQGRLDDFPMEIKFGQPAPWLAPGASTQIGMKAYLAGRQTDFLTAHIDPRYASLKFDIVVEYSDVEGREYRVTQRVAPGSLTGGKIE